MKKFIKSAGAAMVAVNSQIALSHTGHGADGGSFSLAHYLTEPEHLVVILAIVVGALLVVWRRGKRKGE